VLPLPSIPGPRLCLISALRQHFTLSPGPSSAPLFATFLSRAVSHLQLDPSPFSLHSFRQGGVTFAFDCHIPSFRNYQITMGVAQRHLSCLFRIN